MIGDRQASTLADVRAAGHELIALHLGNVALQKIFDVLPCGVALVLRDLQVWSMNARARAWVEQSNGLTIVEQRLTCMDGRSQQRLQSSIQQLQAALARDAAASTSISLRAARAEGVDLQLQITPLSFSHGADSVQDAPAYCIWIFDVAGGKCISKNMLRELHGLTAAEADVAAALYRGLSIEDAGKELRVSVNTVKTHLKRVFQKCEVRSQAELLQMLALGPR